jgi:hypothetical protein
MRQWARAAVVVFTALTAAVLLYVFFVLNSGYNFPGQCTIVFGCPVNASHNSAPTPMYGP